MSRVAAPSCPTPCRAQLLALLALALPAAAAEPKTSGSVGTAAAPAQPALEPTAEETLLLELVNRYRAAPLDEVEILLPPSGDAAPGIPAAIDRGTMRKEMRKFTTPSPPLVFSPALLRAARGHSEYMVRNGQAGGQSDGKPGFTGKDLAARLKQAGYAGAGLGQIQFRDGPSDPWQLQVLFLANGADLDKDAKSRQSQRKVLMEPKAREIGIAAVPHDGKLSATYVIGARTGARVLGGVVYEDLDHDGAYDIGEGRGGVSMRIGDQTIATCASGAYAMDLPAAGEALLMADAGDWKHTQPLPSAGETIVFSWRLPLHGDIAKADALLAEVAKFPDANAPSAAKAVADLYIGSRGLCLDQARAGRLETLVGDLERTLHANQQAVREAMYEEAAVFKKVLAEKSKPFKSTALGTWFSDAGDFQQARDLFGKFQAGDRKAAPTIKQLEKIRDGMVTPDFRSQVEALIAKAAEPPAPKKEKK